MASEELKKAVEKYNEQQGKDKPPEGRMTTEEVNKLWETLAEAPPQPGNIVRVRDPVATPPCPRGIPHSARPEAEQFYIANGCWPQSQKEVDNWKRYVAAKAAPKAAPHPPYLPSSCPGYKYNLDTDSCANCGLDAIEHGVKAMPSPVLDQERTHILHQGSPICRFSRERPQDWPKGHYWVSMQAFTEGATINCDPCSMGYFTITGRKPRD